MCLKVSKESKPGWVYTRRREPFLRIVAHMSDVHERSRGWGRYERLGLPVLLSESQRFGIRLIIGDK